MQLSLFDNLKAEVAATPAGIVPRDYQQDAIQTAFDLWARGSAGVIVRQPTGSGKTLTATLMADQWLGRSKDHRVIVLAHERQLVHQFADEIEDILGERPGIEMANECVPANKIPRVTVASRQSLLPREVQAEGGDEDAVSRLDKFDPIRYHWLVILDEVHRWLFALKSCRHILEWFSKSPHNKRLGLTATPERGDKKTLSRVTPDVAADYRLYDIDGGPCAVRDGWAVEYDQRFVTVVGVDFKTIREVAKDFDKNELHEVLSQRENLLGMVKPTLDIVGDRRTIVFNVTVDMAKWVAHTINEFKPGQAVSLDGSAPDHRRKDVYRRHQAGKFQFLSVCGLCLGSGTLILTDKGEVPIELVTTDMTLWDGVEFVPHDGVISKGVKPVIEYAGLTATGDHNVWTGDGWVSLSACKQQRLEIRVGGIEGKAVLESDGYHRGANSSRETKASGAGGKVRRLWGSQRQSHIGNQKVPGWVQKLLQVFRCPELAIDALSFCKKTMREFTRHILQGLRREGSQVQLCHAGGNGQVDYGKPWPTQGLHHRPHRQRGPLRTGEHSVGQPEAAGDESACPTTRIYPEPKRHTQTEEVEVYDILNAGPRNRFTASGLIVSNCREGYNDPGIGAVAVFRPTKSRGLAEQMKGRGCRPLRGCVDSTMTREERLAAIATSSKPSCVIVDLVGITGMADCASTAHIMAEGKPDEVIQRANENAIKKDGPVDMAEEVRKAQGEINEERQAAIDAAIERQRKEREEAERCAKLVGVVTYSERKVQQGGGSRVHQPKRRRTVMPFGKHKGTAMEDIDAGYLRWVAKDVKTQWIRNAAQGELDQRAGKSNTHRNVDMVEDVNAAFNDAACY